MSVRSDSRICVHCGLVELASRMVKLVGDDYEYACQGCAATEGSQLP